MIALSLEEILQRKKEQKEKESISVDWEKEKSLWIQSVDTLYANIENWLAPYKKKKNF